MFKRIVVPLDGSAFAEAALAPACELARTFQARIVLVRAIPPSGLPRTLAQDGDETTFGRLDEADLYLHDTADRLKSEGIEAGRVLYVAEPGEAIAHAAEIDHADLIVMTAHPRWRVDYLDSASTTLQVLCHTRVPILAWRAGAGMERSDRRKSGADRLVLASLDAPIMVPLDGSRVAEAALPVAEVLAQQIGSYLVLVRPVESAAESAVVLPPRTSADESVQVTAEEEAKRYLERIREGVELRGVGAGIQVRQGSAVGVIDSVWREQNVSLIVMASQGTTGIGRRFLGSVAAQTIEDVGAPVLVVRPDTGHAIEYAGPERWTSTEAEPVTGL